jgi:uncharacterized membrane protein
MAINPPLEPKTISERVAREVVEIEEAANPDSRPSGRFFCPFTNGKQGNERKYMRKLLFSSALAAVIALSYSLPAFAASDEKAEVEIKGQAKCAKCMLKEGDECQTVIETKAKDGKTVKYYIADNKVAKEFHENVCTEAKKVTATGTVKEVNGKKELTLSKIELVKTT